MGRLNNFARERIIFLHHHGFNMGEIVRILKEDDFATTRQTVSRFIRRYNENEVTKPVVKRRPTKLTTMHFDFIKKALRKRESLRAVGKLCFIIVK